MENVVGTCTIFYSNGWNTFREGVRPVVSLKSDVTTAQVKKLTNQDITEDAWSGYTGTYVKAGTTDNGEAGNHGN